MSLDVLLFHPKMPGMPLKHAVEEMESCHAAGDAACAAENGG